MSTANGNILRNPYADRPGAARRRIRLLFRGPSPARRHALGWANSDYQGFRIADRMRDRVSSLDTGEEDPT
jgi:hypothetical protein